MFFFYSKCCSKQLKGTMVHKWKTCAQLHDAFGTSTVDTWTCQGTKWHITLYHFWGVIILSLYAGGCHDDWSGGGLGFYRSQNRYWVTGYGTGDLLVCLCKSMCCLVPGYSSVLVFEVWFLVFHTLVLPCLPSWFTLGVLYTDGPLLFFTVCSLSVTIWVVSKPQWKFAWSFRWPFYIPIFFLVFASELDRNVPGLAGSGGN